MTDRFHTVRAEGISVTLDLSIGHLRDLEVRYGGGVSRPLHKAPWTDEANPPREADSAPNLLALAGDFLCAPFGGNDVEPAPSHGWTANSPWSLVEEVPHPSGGRIARFRLERPVFGATVTKELILRDGQPFLYQRHLFTGGEGAITAAHHVNTRMPEGGRLFFSPKAYADIPDTPLEPDPSRGRYVLAYPSRTENLSALPLAAGGTVDLHRYPIGERHEDFVMLVEAPGRTLGWTAVRREAEGDMMLVLKHPATLPVTLLWFSNGGRDYAPWNGRHTGVLGIEDGRCWSLYGHRASIEDNPLSREGIPTSFDLVADGVVELRHVIGAIPPGAAPESVDAVEAGEQGLRVSGGGRSMTFPYDSGFLAGS